MATFPKAAKRRAGGKTDDLFGAALHWDSNDDLVGAPMLNFRAMIDAAEWAVGKIDLPSPLRSHVSQTDSSGTEEEEEEERRGEREKERERDEEEEEEVERRVERRGEEEEERRGDREEEFECNQMELGTSLFDSQPFGTSLFDSQPCWHGPGAAPVLNVRPVIEAAEWARETNDNLVGAHARRPADTGREKESKRRPPGQGTTDRIMTSRCTLFHWYQE